jgi:hypothetical protein
MISPIPISRLILLETISTRAIQLFIRQAALENIRQNNRFIHTVFGSLENQALFLKTEVEL